MRLVTSYHGILSQRWHEHQVDRSKSTESSEKMKEQLVIEQRSIVSDDVKILCTFLYNRLP